VSPPPACDENADGSDDDDWLVGASDLAHFAPLLARQRAARRARQSRQSAASAPESPLVAATSHAAESQIESPLISARESPLVGVLGPSNAENRRRLSFFLKTPNKTPSAAGLQSGARRVSTGKSTGKKRELRSIREAK